jgi:hypothetical protein
MHLKPNFDTPITRYTIHFFNFTGASRIAYLVYTDKSNGMNLLGDKLVLISLLLSILLHLLLWQCLSQGPLRRNYNTIADLGKMAHGMTERMYGHLFYVIRLYPGIDQVYMAARKKMDGDLNPTEPTKTVRPIKSNLELVQMIINVDGFILLNLGVVLLSVFGLSLGIFKKNSTGIIQIAEVRVALGIALHGILVVSSAYVIFYTLFNSKRSE